jgi:hypothetical protein
MRRITLILVLLFLSFAPFLKAETRRHSRVYYHGWGTGDAAVIAGIEAGAGVLEKWLEVEARKELARGYAAHPGIEFAYPKSGTRPLSRAVSQRRFAEVPTAIPSGFWQGSNLHSPWSSMTFQGETFRAGDTLFDPLTGLPFVVPEAQYRDAKLSSSQ